MGEAPSASVNPLTQLGSGITGSLIIGRIFFIGLAKKFDRVIFINFLS